MISKGMHFDVHTLFVSNPCMATAIILVSQNLFYEQLPDRGVFFLLFYTTCTPV